MSAAPETVYGIPFRDRKGGEHRLDEYRGEVLLIVNTASECGFTPQLEGLQELHEQFRERGFHVLGFPCNQFGGQEPLEGEAIGAFCRSQYGVTFPVFDKVDVKGPDAHPLYRLLGDKDRNGAVGARPRWNFHKYLVDRQGRVRDYFLPLTKPDAARLRKAVERLLEEPADPA
jgi:glutathione peroxidase